MRGRVEILVGVAASIAVLAVLLAKPPGWDVLAIVGATLLPAGLVLYGAAARRRARDVVAQQTRVDAQRAVIAREAAETSESRSELARRLDELGTLNELAGVLTS